MKRGKRKKGSTTGKKGRGDGKLEEPNTHLPTRKGIPFFFNGKGTIAFLIKGGREILRKKERTGTMKGSAYHMKKSCKTLFP